MKLKKSMNWPEGIRLQVKPLAVQNESGGCMESVSGHRKQEILKMMAVPWLMMG